MMDPLCTLILLVACQHAGGSLSERRYTVLQTKNRDSVASLFCCELTLISDLSLEVLIFLLILLISYWKFVWCLDYVLKMPECTQPSSLKGKVRVKLSVKQVEGIATQPWL